MASLLSEKPLSQAFGLTIPHLYYNIHTILITIITSKRMGVSTSNAWQTVRKEPDKHGNLT
jgi:hypothetical protein